MNLRKDHYPSSFAIATHPSGTSERCGRGAAHKSSAPLVRSSVPGCDERERVGGAFIGSACSRTDPLISVWQTWVLPRYWSGEGSGAPATLFGWDRLDGAGGPGVAALHCLALCTAHLAKNPYGSVGRSVGRSVNRPSQSPFFLFRYYSFACRRANLLPNK